MTTLPIDTWLESALGAPPFPWQRRLLGDLLNRHLPRALDLPTGLGKTSVMAIWLVARAAGATHLPRRLVYVVDRRAVVDQATRVAEGLRTFVASHEEVREALGLTRALPISTLRGQFADNREWLSDPTIPAIVVGTVDMIGSRLLFEGYACSRKMRPYHAGMLGLDSLLVLDEAHLVPPFERLLEQVPAAAFWPEVPVGVPGIRLLSLSATGRQRDAFKLDGEDHDHDVVKKRIGAVKRATWGGVPEGGYAEAAAKRAWSLATDAGRSVRVLVFSNSRADAEKAKDAVLKLAAAERGRTGTLPSTTLLVGGRRIRERTEAEKTLVAMGFVAAEKRPAPTDHAFLFATSAGEVGVDLDADHLVADVVAWERMVQRLGRVNRRGEGEAAVVFLAEEEANWIGLVRELFDALPEEPDGSRLVGPSALGALRTLHPARVRAASTPEPSYPALTLPLVEAWAMTSLRVVGRPM